MGFDGGWLRTVSPAYVGHARTHREQATTTSTKRTAQIL